MFTYCIENGILQGLLDAFEPSNDNTNVVNALQEPFVVKQDPGAHYGYNCPPKVLIIPDSEPFNNQAIDELPQTLPSFDPTCYSEDGNSFTYNSKSNLVDDSPNIFNPPPQPLTYSYEFCGNDADYGHDCPLQVPFTYDMEPDDNDEDCTIAITPILTTEEPYNSLRMGDEHLDTIPAMKLDEFIKSSDENLVRNPSESEGIPDNMCDVPFHDNSPPLDISKDQFEDFFDSNNDSTSIDDDSFSIDNIEYVEVSPPDSKLISSEAIEIVILEIGGIDADILETNTFDNSLPEFETFCFDLEEISSGSTTTRSDISLPDYEAFYDDHVKEISSGSTTTHSNSSLYDLFIFDLSINPFPPAGRCDFYHEEFVDELAHIISPPENEDTIFDPGISSYHISSFMPDVSHQSGTFIKFNVYSKHLNERLMEILFSIFSPVD
nr:hypothetical protein [Tanacetum cinerariifolium]